MAADRVLTRRALSRALLERQMLLSRRPIPVADVIERLVGMQAQEPQDPYVALWSRIEGFRAEELSTMVEERRVARLPNLMRTTIHLVTDRDALTLRAAMQPVLERAWRHRPFSRNLMGLDLDEVLAAGRALLAEGPQPMGQIGKRLKERWPQADAVSLGYAVRTLVPLVQVPPRGLWRRSGQAVLQELEHWLGRPLDPAPSLETLVLRYLAAFGPATPADFRIWSWISGIREVFERLRPRLRTFRDEAGRELFDVPDGPLPDPETPAPVRFLPAYDNLTLSHDDRSRVIDRQYALESWLRATLLVDGFVRGTWRLDLSRGGAASMALRVAKDMTPPQRDEIEAESHRLIGFMAPEAKTRELSWSVLPG